MRRPRLPRGLRLEGLRAHGAVCGIPLPAGLREADRLPRTLFTPSTKATSGHDENITAEQGIELVGEQRYREVERASIALYERAAASALERGIILADTKFEFGIDADGSLVVGDEVLTPDSSRFWPADSYAPGSSPPSFDKQYVRDWLRPRPGTRRRPGPSCPTRCATARPRATARPTSDSPDARSRATSTRWG